jgi:hypothetical protein
MYSKILTGALVSADLKRPYSNNLSEIPEGANDCVGKPRSQLNRTLWSSGGIWPRDNRQLYSAILEHGSDNLYYS